MFPLCGRISINVNVLQYIERVLINHGWTALHEIVVIKKNQQDSNRAMRCFELLLSHGADVNIRKNDNYRMEYTV